MPTEVRSGGAPIRVALAPDVPLVIAGTTALLSGADPAMVVLELPRTRDEGIQVDVVLYDPQRFRRDGTPGASLQRPRLTIVAYSWSTRPETVAQARAQGAVGYLSKELDAATLVACIRSLHSGNRTRFLVQPDPVEPSGAARPDGLTRRELEMLELITSGLSNDEIARQLFLSINSVKTYIRSAYRKIGVTRRPQAVLWGVHHGFDVRSPEGALR